MGLRLGSNKGRPQAACPPAVAVEECNKSALYSVEAGGPGLVPHLRLGPLARPELRGREHSCCVYVHEYYYRYSASRRGEQARRGALPTGKQARRGALPTGKQARRGALPTFLLYCSREKGVYTSTISHGRRRWMGVAQGQGP